MAENEEKIVLTLGEEAVAEEETVEEEVVEEKPHATVPVSDIVGHAKLDDSGLSEEEKKMVSDFSKQIDIMETNSILQYGATAQTKVADFSETALKNVRTKDIDTIGDTLLDLVSELRNFDVDEKDGFFTKLFKKGANSINDVKAKYDSANVNVDKIVKILENHQITLMKDINLLDQLYEKNLVNFKELTMYILAGYQRLEEIKQMLASRGLQLGQTSAKTSIQDLPEVDSSIDIETLNKPIASMGFSVRARKCMSRSGIATLGDLIRKTADELLQYKNFGVTSLAEVRDKLETYGLHLHGE